MSESKLLTANLLLAIPTRYPSVVCWRNNTGGAVPVAAAQKAMGLIRSQRYKEAIDALGRVIKFGLAGQADISGFATCRNLAVRIEIEVKAGKDTQSQEQKVFEKVLKEAGGIYIVVREMEQGLADLGEALRVCQKMS